MSIDRQTLFTLIRTFEGCRLHAYLCPAGVWTCGWGSTGRDVHAGTAWTQEHADERLAQDAEQFIRATARLCPGLSAKPAAAIADFAYNLGATRLAGSTLRRLINAGRMNAAKVEIKKWRRGGGRILPGLVKRRAAEAALL